jgi:hypothetical protein
MVLAAGTQEVIVVATKGEAIKALEGIMLDFVFWIRSPLSSHRGVSVWRRINVLTFSNGKTTRTLIPLET